MHRQSSEELSRGTILESRADRSVLELATWSEMLKADGLIQASNLSHHVIDLKRPERRAPCTLTASSDIRTDRPPHPSATLSLPDSMVISLCLILIQSPLLANLLRLSSFTRRFLLFKRCSIVSGTRGFHCGLHFSRLVAAAVDTSDSTCGAFYDKHIKTLLEFLCAC